MKQITKVEWDAICDDYKGTYLDYDGSHPEWKGRRTGFLPGCGTQLFIEGVHFKITVNRLAAV